jgi:hypothetical protein
MIWLFCLLKMWVEFNLNELVCQLLRCFAVMAAGAGFLF